MTERRYDMAKDGVSKVFTRPHDIVRAPDLSPDEKRELLRDWEIDLREVLVASEEGMTRSSPGDVGEILRQVRLGLDELGARGSDTPAPNKAGGG